MLCKDQLDANKYKNIKKSENEIIEILTKSKIRNLFKSRFKNLILSKNPIKV